MGNDKMQKDDKENMRYQVPKNEIVVHGAKITCSYAGKSKTPDYLYIPDNHGIMEGERNCAHDEDCIPIRNIKPFKYCQSYYAKQAIMALLPTASAEEQKRYNEALSAIKYNETHFDQKLVPCVLALLDRWFDADEKNIVTDSMKFGREILLDIKGLQKKLNKSLNKAINSTYILYAGALYILPKDVYIEYMNHWQKLKKIKEELKKIFSEFDLFAISIDMGDNKFHGTIKNLEDIEDRLNKIIKDMDEAHNIYSRLDGYNTLKTEFQELVSETKKLKSTIINWKEKEYHLILTNSFLVCRCGGIISFLTSGQEHMLRAKTLLKSILDTVTRFKDHCIKGQTDYCIREIENDVYESYKHAAEGLEIFEKVVGPATDEMLESPQVSIYMELISHSYNDEMRQRILTALAVIGNESKMITFLCSIITLCLINEESADTSDVVSGISANIDALNTFEIIDQLGGKKITYVNGLYGNIMNIQGALYTSYETWIECVRITVFTDTHAHVKEQYMDINGRCRDGINDAHIYSKADYITNCQGRGLQWKENPGAYLARREHIGDKLDYDEEIDRSKKIVNMLPVN